MSDLVSNQGLFILLISCCFVLVVFLIRVYGFCASLRILLQIYLTCLPAKKLFFLIFSHSFNQA